MPLHLFSRGPIGLRTLLTLILLGGLAAAGSASAAGPICRVATSGTSAGNGSDWTTQAMALQTALTTSACTEIWVAAGTYTPTSGSDRTISFNLHPGVAVYGGFFGTETQRSARNPAANITTLSGEIGAPGNGDNSFHVIFINGTTGSITASTVLDGFTISGGNANGSTDPQFNGGGMYCNGQGNGNQCSPTLSGLTFSGNTAFYSGGGMYNNGQSSGTSNPILNNLNFAGNVAETGYGGGMYNNGGGGLSSPTLSNVTFSDNSAQVGGGAIYNMGYSAGNSSPTLDNVSFSGNHVQYGGGAMFNDGNGHGVSNPTLSNVTFSDNGGGNSGGAVYNYGAYNGTSSPTFNNVTFSGNSAQQGGAMYNDGSSGGTSNPILSNVIAWNDNAPSGGPEIDNYSGATPTIDHSVIQGSGGSGGWIGLGSDGGGNLDADPLLGALANNGGLTQTMLPGFGSSAIDTGNDITCTSLPVGSRDQRGVSRPQGPHCDIGAVEVVSAVAVINAVGGSGQHTGVWTSFFNPLVVQVHDSVNRVVQNVHLQALPAPSGQPGALCSDGITDDAGFALLYCRANGSIGGPYAVKVSAPNTPAVSPATFLLTNTAGDGDLIFQDGFDPPGPRTSVMLAGITASDFTLAIPGNTPEGVSLPIQVVTDTQHRHLALVEARRQGGSVWLRVTHYADHGRRAQTGTWQVASPQPRLHVDVTATGSDAYLH